MNNEMYNAYVAKIPYISEIMTQLHSLRVEKEATLVLVGSYVRDKQTWRSDRDFIVVTPERIKRWRVPLNIHIIFNTRSEFIDKLIHGNDFQHWAVRFGKVLTDSAGWWDFVRNSEGITDIWPDWRLKVKHAKKSLSIASPLLLDNDLDNAQDEYLLVASHIARALLLQSKIFPLSRPELPEQLKLIGQNDLSKIIEGLIYGIETHEELITLSKTIDMILSNIQLEADDSGQSEYLNTAVPAISS